MTSEIQIRVFSLSSADIFEENRLDYAIYWLMKKGNNRYYFRKMKPRNLPVGSIVLFSFQGKIFGQAITNEEIRMTSTEEQSRKRRESGFVYKATVRFEPSSIDVFPKYPLKKDIEEKFGIRFSRLFTPLTWEQYQEVLRMAERRP